MKKMRSDKGSVKIPLIDRIQSKYEAVTETGCWIWTASTNSAGYGQISMPGRPMLAHRVCWEFYNGQIPDGKFICHKCDTPSCVNPSHMFVGDHHANMADMRRKGRAAKVESAKGEKNNSSKINNETALAIFNAVGPQKEICRRFNVSRSTLQAIKYGRQWSSVTGKEYKNANR